jgi:hypothetical protein
MAIALDNIQKKLIQDNNYPTFLGHVVLTGCSLFFVGLSYCGLFITGDHLEKQWLDSTDPAPVKQSQAQLQQSKLFDQTSSAEENKQQIRLAEQLNTIDNSIINHRKIMAFFYKQYFISLSIGSTAALVSLFCVFFVSKEGWGETNNALINVCVTSIGVTLFFLNSSQVFQQAENLKASQNLYNSYTVLRNEFRSSLAAKKLLAETNTEKPEGYIPIIQYTDSRLKDLSLIRLGFDPTSIIEAKNRVDSVLGLGTTKSPAPTVKSSEAPPPK